jgi:hypothetical protein
VKADTINIIFIIMGISLILNPIFLQSIQISAIKFEPVPFDRIPVARINSNNNEYEIGADFSIDYGDEPVIKRANDSNLAKNMTLSKQDKGLSLELECDSNDICGTSLAPSSVTIYLVNSSITYDQIVNDSVSNLELGYNDCGTDLSKIVQILTSQYPLTYQFKITALYWTCLLMKHNGYLLILLTY